MEIKSYNLENYQKEITSEIDIYKKQNIVQRLFDHGHTIWSESPDEIINRLGWLESFEEIHEGRKLKKADSDNFAMKDHKFDILSLNPKNLSDEKLVRYFVENKDEEAFNEIVNRYTDNIYRIAFGIIRDRDKTEDVLQEVFLILTRKLDTFRGKSKFSTWLYRITVNASYIHLRSEKKHENEISLEDYVPYDENGTLMGKIKSKDWSNRPDILIFSNEAMQIIEKAVSELPESYRVVFQLRDVEELSNEEVSEILDLTVPAVKSRVHRARLFLRDRLSDYFYEWRKN